MSEKLRSSSPTSKGLQQTGTGGTNINVAIRCRPTTNEESRQSQSAALVCDTDNKSLTLSFGPPGKKTAKNYAFEKCFDAQATQEDIFESVARPVVNEALAGYNCTIFAYGQTGTGKTHTMEGDFHSEELAGIVPRSVNAILDYLEGSDADYSVRVSFLELYNEELLDLLATGPEKKLKLYEDVKKGVVCQNLLEILVTSANDIFEILEKAMTRRQTAATLMNKNSSRSHSIFTMKIMMKECNSEGEEVVKNGQLNLVDLAGSECIGRSGAKNERAREAGSINQSLLTLGRVITALVDHHSHIPYRDSKLTRLLQESLGGKAKTSIIATMSGSQQSVEETMATLDCANKAKLIKNNPVVNLRVTKKAILREYLLEIEILKAQLQQTRDKTGVYVDAEVFYAMEAKIAAQDAKVLEIEAQLKAQNEEMEGVKYARDDLIDKLDECETTLRGARNRIGELDDELAATQADLARVHAEWKASEQVVREQMHTEHTLHIQGEALQEEVTARRNDIMKLLDEVTRYSDSEAARVKSASRLVGGIAASTLNLQDGIANMAANSKTQSVVLVNGVDEMLKKGKTTCAALKAAIDGALTILITDATKAKSNMTSSCDKLEADLGVTNSHVAKTLMDLKNNLSKWLGEVDEGMKNAQLLLVKQNTQLEGLTAAFVQQATEYGDLSAKFVIQLDIDFKIVTDKTSNLGEVLQTMFLAYSDSFLKHAQISKELIEAKAIAVEETFKKLLHELVSTATEYISVSSTSAGTFTTTASKTTKTGLWELDQALSTTNTHIKSHTSLMVNKFEDYRNTQNLKLITVGETRTSTDVILSGFSKDVGARRTNLDTTVTTLVNDVNMALKKAGETVKETSASADKILKDVVSATQSMNAASKESLTTFEDYINKEGAVTQNGLTEHFKTLDAHLVSQKTGLTGINSNAEQYGETAQITLGVVGGTPKKTIFRPLDTLVKTRDHETIRSEIKGPLMLAPVQVPQSYTALSVPASPAKSPRSPAKLSSK